MYKVRLLCMLSAALLMLPSSTLSAQGAHSSLNVFLTFLLDPDVVISQHDLLIVEKSSSRSGAFVQQPIAITPGDPPTVQYMLAASTPRGGRGYARLRSFMRFTNYSLEPSHVTIDWTADLFLAALAGRQTMSRASALLVFRPAATGLSERVSAIRFSPPDAISGSRTGQVALFLPAAHSRADGSIRPTTTSMQVLAQAGVSSLTTVPEPISIVLLGTGLAAVGWVRRRRQTEPH